MITMSYASGVLAAIASAAVGAAGAGWMLYGAIVENRILVARIKRWERRAESIQSWTSRLPGYHTTGLFRLHKTGLDALPVDSRTRLTLWTWPQMPAAVAQTPLVTARMSAPATQTFSAPMAQTFSTPAVSTPVSVVEPPVPVAQLSAPTAAVPAPVTPAPAVPQTSTPAAQTTDLAAAPAAQASVPVTPAPAQMKEASALVVETPISAAPAPSSVAQIPTPAVPASDAAQTSAMTTDAVPLAPTSAPPMRASVPPAQTLDLLTQTLAPTAQPPAAQDVTLALTSKMDFFESLFDSIVDDRKMQLAMRRNQAEVRAALRCTQRLLMQSRRHHVARHRLNSPGPRGGRPRSVMTRHTPFRWQVTSRLAA